MGNKTAITRERRGLAGESGRYEYGYDALARLESVTRNGERLRSYAYDSFGNRTGMEDYEAGRQTSSAYDALNRLVTAEEIHTGNVITGSAVRRSYGYDRRGNLIREEKDGEFLRGYEYGAMDRMTKAWNGRGQESDYFYNGLGQRMGRTINGEEEDYLLDLSKPCHNLLGISKGDSRQSFYFDNNVSAMEEEGNLHFYLQDELGSPLRVSGYGAGKKAEDIGNEYLTYGYDEFGSDLYKELEKAGIPCPYDRQGEEQPFGYTGYRFDDVSGTYFAQAREYRAENGRFTAEDVIKGNGAAPETLNQYIYCWNTPFLYIDLGGDAPEIPEYILELIEQGDDAHQTLIRYAFSSPHEGTLKAPAYIPTGLKREKNRKKGEGFGYYTKSGHGFADFVLYDKDTGILEVYELKHDSAYGKERGPVQLQAYIDAISDNLDEFNEVHHWNVTEVVQGTSMLGVFNNHYPSISYGKEIHYHMDPQSPGMIYWSYAEEQKQPAKQPYVGMSKEEIDEFFRKTGYVLGGIGIGMLGVILYLDNAVPGGEGDDYIAEELLLKAMEFFENAFGKCTLMH